MVAILIVATTVAAFSLVSSRLRGRPITPPMLFLAGLIVGPGALGLVHVDVNNEVLRVLAEATLVVVLFTDASRMQIDRVWHQHDTAHP